ncbi:MAG TPA: S8 family serine peptidase [Vicinamibacterales bacterium]|nr:S8 family serine peptidase [Vicinamibacterales bacterium]
MNVPAQRCRVFGSSIRISLAAALALVTLGAEALFGQGQAPSNSRRTVVLDGREVVEGEVIVRYHPQAGQIGRQRAEFQANSDVSEPIGQTRRLRSWTLSTSEMLAVLRANPDVLYAEPNYIIRANATPNDPMMNSLWALLNTGQTVDGQAGTPGADIGATTAWDVTTGSRTNIVAILDSGVDFTHPDIDANLFRAPRQFSVTIGSLTITCTAGTSGFNAQNNSCTPYDDNGHGTHVAGIIGAVGNNGIGVTGVNWTANLMALKVLGADGTGTTAEAVKAINWAIKAKAALAPDANIRILNASWGGAIFSQALSDEIAAANNADMLFVAAAGSNGSNNDAVPHYPASLTHPNVVSVGAVDNTGEMAPFSNYGATSVDLAAPGGSILSTLPENAYGELGGTSMSAAFVSGAAALMLSFCPADTATLKARLLASVQPVSSLAGKTVSGGRLNVGAAVLGPCAELHATINGGTITATVEEGPGNPKDWLGLYCPASNGDQSTFDWKFLNGSKTAPTSGFTAATVTFQAPSQIGMTCNVRLFANNTYTKLATSETVTRGAAAAPAVTASPASVTPGSAISVTVSNGPANQMDWVALYDVSAADSTYLQWMYLSGTKNPPATGLANATVQFTAPATPGNYNVRFFSNNSFTKLATSGTVTVAAATPTPSLSIGDVSINEGNSGTSVATFTVTLSPVNSSQTVTVNYATADGSATVAGNDYVATSGTLSFPPSTATRTISVTINGDTVEESNETFFVNLSGAANAAIADAQGVGVITTEEAAAGPTVTVASTTVAPGGVIQFTVSGGPANQKDWVALFDTSAPDTVFSQWMYLNGTKTAPASGLSGATLQFTAPATPGTYNIRFFADNGYTKLATSATVTVCPCITVASATVAPGAPISFTISGGPANPKDWVGLFRTGASDTEAIDWMFLSGSKTAPASGLSNVTLQFTAPATAGTYNIRFFSNNSYTKLATSVTITVTVSITVASTTVAPGAQIAFTVSGGPANRNDWVGLYNASAPDNTFVQWMYLSGSKTPPASGLSGASLQFTAPTTPGNYNIRFFVNDSFTKLATSVTITVSP